MGALEDINQILSEHSPDIQALVHELRRLIHTIQPDLVEDASVKLKVIYFRHRGVVCALSPHKSHVNLHFYKGLQLADPDGVLKGSGKMLRHLEFRTSEDVEPELVRRFVEEAYALNRKP